MRTLWWTALLLLMLFPAGAQAHCFMLEAFGSSPFGVCYTDGPVYVITWVFLLWLMATITFGLLLLNPRVHLLIKVVLLVLSLPVSLVLLPLLFALQWLQQRLGWLQPLAVPNVQEQELAKEVAVAGVQTASPTQLLPLGHWQLNPVTHQLGLEGEWQTLEPKVYQLLVYFIEHQGRVISLEELHQNIWTGQVVTDTAVRRSISKLRHALGDTDAKNPRFIHSVMKRGYRFVLD